jgi:hypothetical protein
MVPEERFVIYRIAGSNLWLCKSRTQEGYWMLSLRSDGGISCGCPGHQYRHECAHAKALERRRRRDSDRRRREAMRDLPTAEEIRAAWSNALPDLEFSEVSVGD